VPLRWGATLQRVERGPKGLVALVGRRDGERLREASEVEVDAVVCGYGFEPENALARALGAAHAFDARRGHLVCARSEDRETSVPNLFAIGDGCGLSGAPSAVEEGVIAGNAVAARLGRRPDAEAVRAARGRLARHLAFQDALWAVFAAPVRGIEAAEADTLVCRCEHVSRGEIEAVLADGAPSLGEVKRRTRLGMGRCQGRYCGPLLARHLAATQGRPLDDQAGFAPRAPVKPVALADLVATGREPAP
jgi:NAD(P)H-nitrite reductase large subunit